jgi:hypothetical protein
MRKLPHDFYTKLAKIRDQFGRAEYNRDQILPAVMGLILEYVEDKNEFLRDAANAILNSQEAQEDKELTKGSGLFPYLAQVALGDKQRIQRGRMTLDQHYRFKRVIDRNKEAQDTAWASQNRWINAGVDVLKDQPPSTVREVVLNEDGTIPGEANETGS